MSATTTICCQCGARTATGFRVCDDCWRAMISGPPANRRPPPDSGGRALAACLLAAVAALALWYGLWVRPHDRAVDAIAACADSRAEPGTPAWRTALDDCQRAARGTAVGGGSVWSHPAVSGEGGSDGATP